MNRQECINSLQNTYQQQNTDTVSLSKITTEARGAEKTDCLQLLWWTAKINLLMQTFTKNPTTHSSASTQQTTPETIQTVEDTSRTTQAKDYTILWGEILIAVVFAYLVRNILKKFLYLLYDITNSHRITYYKVLLPRGEGKVDREESKEIAKDMKEKIGRMGQVFSNLSRLWALSATDDIMRVIFKKPKISCIYNYEDGRLHFIIATYPEYESIVHSAIGSQYPDASIEVTEKPKIFGKKYNEIIPLESEKQSFYTIKMYKTANDDQMNNIVDAIWSLSKYDTANIVMTVKPVSESRNNQAKKQVSRLYKNLSIDSPRSILRKPRKRIMFLIKWPQKQKNEDDVGIVRMVKAQEDTLNAMAEEAGTRAFETSIMLVISSDDALRAENGLKSVISAYSVYTDEYGNELKYPTTTADIVPWLVKPIRKIMVNNLITHIFYISNIFSINELASLFHFPAKIYNRSDAIQWLDYKVLPAPENIPSFENENGYIITGVIAEKYKNGDIAEILEEDKYLNNKDVGTKKIREEKLVPIEKLSKEQQQKVKVIEQDGQKMAKVTVEKEVKWFKLYNDGIFLGVNIFRNTLSPVYMKRNDRTRHHYMIGKSGTWKSVFLESLARQDARNGDGFCLIDPHGDLAEGILQYIPKERAKDVVYFDAGDELRPMGLNLYEINSLDEADRTVNDATEIFLKMFGPEIFGPRIQEYFKYGSLTLMEDFEDRPTLLDVPRLFTDEAYREYKIKKVTNPVVKNFREKTYNAMGDREKQEIIPYFTSKFVSFNTNRLIRNIIGQTKSAFNFDDIMNNKKILLISLSKGKIGELNAQLLGMIIVSKIYNAAMARARIPEEERKDFYLYVDEFQNFISGTFADILSEARKYRLSLIMAHQYIAQLEWGWSNNIWQDKWWKSDVKAAVFGNVGTMMSFKVGAPDAEFLEKEYVPILAAWDIVGIANYKSYIKLNIDNSTSRPFSMNSVYTKDYKNKKIVPILKEYSAKKYGRKREFIDAEIQARLGLTVDETSLPETTTPQTNTTETQNTQQENTQEKNTTQNQ